MKKIVAFILIFIITSAFSYGKEDNTYLSGKIQSAEFLKNANSFVRAVIEGDDSKVEALLNLGADPNEKYTGIPVIYFASHLKYDNIMNLLLKHGADPDTTFMRESVLKYSIYRKCTKCVSNLILFGADVNKKSAGCSSPLDFALQLKDTESAGMLLKAGGVPTKKSYKLMKKIKYKEN